MKTFVLAAGAVALLLSAGSAVAAGGKNRTATVAGPKQPIPYAQLEAYLKASPSQRASRDWWSGAATGAGVSASATAPASAAPTAPAPMDSAPMSSPPAASSAGADANASTPSARDSAAPPIPGASPNAPTTVNPPAANQPSGDDTGPPASNTTRN